MNECKYTFSIYYFSEVSVDLTLTEGYELAATHPTEGVGIDCWFHFGGNEPNCDPLVYTGDSIIDVLAMMAGRLFPGASPILEQKTLSSNPRESFFTAFLIAFRFGSAVPAGPNYPEEWTNRAGRKLMNRFDELEDRKI